MKKIIVFILLFFCSIGLVNAEEYDIQYVVSDENCTGFDIVVDYKYDNGSFSTDGYQNYKAYVKSFEKEEIYENGEFKTFRYTAHVVANAAVHYDNVIYFYGYNKNIVNTYNIDIQLKIYKVYSTSESVYIPLNSEKAIYFNTIPNVSLDSSSLLGDVDVQAFIEDTTVAEIISEQFYAKRVVVIKRLLLLVI